MPMWVKQQVKQQFIYDHIHRQGKPYIMHMNYGFTSLTRLFFNCHCIRDATQSPEKCPIFSPLKIGGGRGINPNFGKIETKDSNCCDRASRSAGKIET